MQSTLSIPLQQSGQPVFIPNFVQVLSGGVLQVAYSVNGAPSSLTVTVQGYKNAAGESPVLDTYVGTADTSRTINLTDNFDSFIITAVWTGGSSSVSVTATVSATGAGNVYQGGFQNVQNGVGSPQGILAAPVGSLYTNLNGGSDTTLWVKESGGSTSAGWTAK